MPRRRPRRFISRSTSLIGLLLVIALTSLTKLQPWQGLVVGVPDGDTIVVRDERGRDVRVRLYGIDAPELHQRGGEQARAMLLRKVMDHKVYLVTIDRDGYGRDVAHVRTSPFPWTPGEQAATTAAGRAKANAVVARGGTAPGGSSRRQSDTAPVQGQAHPAGGDLSNDVNGDMLRAGQAWFYGEYCRLPYPCLAWYHAANKARETNIGLWKSRNPTPPWEWRRMNR